MTHFCLLNRILKIFSKFQKSETSNVLQVNFWEYLNHHTNHTCSWNRIFYVFWSSKISLIFGSKNHQKCTFTTKYCMCDDCDILKSWLAISLRFLIFGILKKSLKFAKKVKNVSFLLKCLFHYVETKPAQLKPPEVKKCAGNWWKLRNFESFSWLWKTKFWLLLQKE